MAHKRSFAVYATAPFQRRHYVASVSYTHLDVYKRQGLQVPDGTPGDMRVTSAAVMMGYANSLADLALPEEHGGVLLTLSLIHI